MMQDLKLIDARPEGRAVWEITIPRYLCNLNGSLHGGGAALLLDMCTMSALGPLASDKRWVFLGGVTRSLSLSYLRDCAEGTPVIVDSYVLQAGRTMALIRGEIKSPDGKIFYTVADHHKVNLGPQLAMLEFEPEPKGGLEPNTHFVLGGGKAML
ncbi:HotDog domain-containing protein [Tricharina praecox]|uniref:HotDog domain-containing protein n=1 Tax=Tricharina praecox TaxID=43433 RepID=UPI0022202064|nr:HotDog domain-containing protein [Tricharina praecox]KAI5852146.1 HotDog domain-containing protein [Tricharina praecox]